MCWPAQLCNRRSLALDLGAAEGQGIVRRLAAEADVPIENFCHGAMAGRGLGADELLAAIPRLIAGSRSGLKPKVGH